MRNIQNSYIPYIVICVLLLALGISIGFNFNKKEVLVEKNNTGRENLENKNEQVKEEPVIIDKNEENQNNNISTNINESSNNPTNIQNNNDSTNNDITYSQEDEAVITNLKNTLNEVNNAKNDQNFANSAKATFIDIVDFLFYDGTIKGITFKNLTEDGKAQVLKIVEKIDNAIEEKIPGYKESISTTASSAYIKASEIIKAGAQNINNFAKEKLGEENYNSIIAAKDELVLYTKNALSFVSDVGNNLFNSAKDKLNNWYQNFKNQ